MADNSNRWQRLTDHSAGRPGFTARQTTEALRQPVAKPAGGRKSRRRSHARSGKIWWYVGLLLLLLLAGILAWQLFFT